MKWPLLAPFRDLLAAEAGDAAWRSAMTAATVFLGTVAVSFIVASGVAAVTAVAGFPVAALVFSALFAVAALALHVLGLAQSTRRAARIAAARSRVSADILLTKGLVQTARPLLPLVAFLAAFALGRRM